MPKKGKGKNKQKPKSQKLQDKTPESEFIPPGCEFIIDELLSRESETAEDEAEKAREIKDMVAKSLDFLNLNPKQDLIIIRFKEANDDIEWLRIYQDIVMNLLPKDDKARSGNKKQKINFIKKKMSELLSRVTETEEEAEKEIINKNNVSIIHQLNDKDPTEMRYFKGWGSVRENPMVLSCVAYPTLQPPDIVTISIANPDEYVKVYLNKQQYSQAVKDMKAKHKRAVIAADAAGEEPPPDPELPSFLNDFIAEFCEYLLNVQLETSELPVGSQKLREHWPNLEVLKESLRLSYIRTLDGDILCNFLSFIYEIIYHLVIKTSVINKRELYSPHDSPNISFRGSSIVTVYLSALVSEIIIRASANDLTRIITKGEFLRIISKLSETRPEPFELLTENDDGSIVIDKDFLNGIEEGIEKTGNGESVADDLKDLELLFEEFLLRINDVIQKLDRAFQSDDSARQSLEEHDPLFFTGRNANFQKLSEGRNDIMMILESIPENTELNRHIKYNLLIGDVSSIKEELESLQMDLPLEADLAGQTMPETPAVIPVPEGAAGSGGEEEEDEDRVGSEKATPAERLLQVGSNYLTLLLNYLFPEITQEDQANLAAEVSLATNCPEYLKRYTPGQRINKCYEIIDYIMRGNFKDEAKELLSFGESWNREDWTDHLANAANESELYKILEETNFREAEFKKMLRNSPPPIESREPEPVLETGVETVQVELPGQIPAAESEPELDTETLEELERLYETISSKTMYGAKTFSSMVHGNMLSKDDAIIDSTIIFHFLKEKSLTDILGEEQAKYFSEETDGAVQYFIPTNKVFWIALIMFILIIYANDPTYTDKFMVKGGVSLILNTHGEVSVSRTDTPDIDTSDIDISLKPEEGKELPVISFNLAVTVLLTGHLLLIGENGFNAGLDPEDLREYMELNYSGWTTAGGEEIKLVQIGKKSTVDGVPDEYICDLVIEDKPFRDTGLLSFENPLDSKLAEGIASYFGLHSVDYFQYRSLEGNIREYDKMMKTLFSLAEDLLREGDKKKFRSILSNFSNIRFKLPKLKGRLMGFGKTLSGENITNRLAKIEGVNNYEGLTDLEEKIRDKLQSFQKSAKLKVKTLKSKKRKGMANKKSKKRKSKRRKSKRRKTRRKSKR